MTGQTGVPPLARPRPTGRPPRRAVPDGSAGRRIQAWTEPPEEPASIPEAADRIGVAHQTVRDAVNEGLVHCWPAAPGLILGHLDVDTWDDRHRYVVDVAELVAVRAAGRGRELRREAALPPAADAAVRFFLAVATVDIHAAVDCPGACALHSPTAHRLARWPLRWASKRLGVVGVMRECRHGRMHPDPDGLPGQLDPLTIHPDDCDGCCTAPAANPGGTPDGT